MHRFTNKVNIDGIKFNNITFTKSGSHAVGFNKSYFIKIEYQAHKNKLLSLNEEISIIKSLNELNCESCPKLLKSGELPDGQPYFIQERIIEKGKPNVYDMIFSLLEQKNLGFYQGDFKPENMVFNGSKCYLVDYDQAQRNDNFKEMGNIEFINWIAEDFEIRRGHDFYSDPNRKFSKTEILSCFEDDAFNAGNTSLLKKQRTTSTTSGLYHKINTSKVIVKGARNLDGRLKTLDKIELKPNESVLDVGCNLGLLSTYLHNRGCKVTGIDLDHFVTSAAQMIANISDCKMNFKSFDIGSGFLPNSSFETIFLFSVLHHVKHMEKAAIAIAANCNRIIMECKLIEDGSMPTKFGWKKTNKWNFTCLEDLIKYLEGIFPDFRFEQCYGKVDRDRYILSFIKLQK